jgi:hypothetical protein
MRRSDREFTDTVEMLKIIENATFAVLHSQKTILQMVIFIHAFIDKLEFLDVETTALSELRRSVDDMLHKMLTK